MITEKIQRGLIARTAIQCIYPDGSGKVGSWLYRGSSPKDEDCAVSPCFEDCVLLFQWCRNNGWQSCGDAHIYQPFNQETPDESQAPLRNLTIESGMH